MRGVDILRMALKVSCFTVHPRLLLLLLFSASVVATVTDAPAPQLKFLGCFADNAYSRDLNGAVPVINATQFGVVSCCQQCQQLGYAYAGLQDDNTCYCGQTYGWYLESKDCKSVCSDGQCGGSLANAVYYTVDANEQANRVLSLDKLSLPFEQARMACVESDGDLITFDVQTNVNDTLSLLSAAGNSVQKVWIGLRRRLIPGPFEWTDENAMHFGSQGAPSLVLWKDGASDTFPCVVLDVTSSSLETAPCTTPFAYVCKAMPPAPPTTDSPVDDSQKLLTMYIVVPLFLTCYGCSCLFYCIHKIRQNCNRNSEKTMQLEKTARHPPLQQTRMSESDEDAILPPPTMTSQQWVDMVKRRQGDDKTGARPKAPIARKEFVCAVKSQTPVYQPAGGASNAVTPKKINGQLTDTAVSSAGLPPLPADDVNCVDLLDLEDDANIAAESTANGRDGQAMGGARPKTTSVRPATGTSRPVTARSKSTSPTEANQPRAPSRAQSRVTSSSTDSNTILELLDIDSGAVDDTPGAVPTSSRACTPVTPRSLVSVDTQRLLDELESTA